MNIMNAIRGDSITSPAFKAKGARAHIRARLVLYVVVCDLVAIFAGSALAGVIRFGTGWIAPALSFALVLGLLHFLVGCILHAFSGPALIERMTAAKLATGSLLSALAIFFMILFATQQSEDASRIQIGFGALFALLLVIVGRLAMVKVARKALGGTLYATVFIDDLPEGIRIGGEARARARSLRWNIWTDDPGGYHELAQMIGTADRAVVRCPADRRVRWSHILQGMNVHAEIVASELTGSSILGVGRCGDDITFVVASGPLGLSDRMIKRIFDMCFAGGALLILLPLLILIAIAIKIDSRGPVFFRQPRIGRQNSLFQIMKFRSMRDERSDMKGLRSTARDDDRITRVGRFIRATSIDELPQLLNVIKGDMSIVGPRPHAVHSTAQNKLFWEVDPTYWHRHACKPGITGLAQVRGHRGATEREQDLRDRLAADLEYLNDWSIWLDMAILFRTLGVVVHRNAF